MNQEEISVLSNSFETGSQYPGMATPDTNDNKVHLSGAISGGRDIDHDHKGRFDTPKPDEESAWENSPHHEDPKKKNYDNGGDNACGSNDHRGVESLLADLSCLCHPTCAKRPLDICGRSGDWVVGNADQVISSLIVAISSIPESISYALIAGLPPSAALQTFWVSNVITAVIGGRPGMISSASGLAALLLCRLVRTDTVLEESGIMFVPYVVMFAGVLQCVAAFVGLGRLVSSFPPPVVVGMVNAMALLIVALQFRYAKEFPLTQEEMADGWRVDGTAPALELNWTISLFSFFGDGFLWISPALNLGIYAVEVATAFGLSLFLPRLTTFLPATLMSVLVVVAIEFGLARQFGVSTPLIGDYGGSQVVTPWETIFSPSFSSRYTLPSLASYEAWKLILGYGFALFATQFTETAIALNVVDRLDESLGPGFWVLVGQGIGNIASGVLCGMGGSGVVSMSVLADRTFGTTCLSTFMTGLIMFLFVTWGYPVVDFIPLSAISGISIAMVCSSIQWRSMVATLTTLLPASKREQLPPQYNIARGDVLVMIIVTAACLIVDVATMLVFVLGLLVFAFTTVKCCFVKKRTKKTLPSEDANEQEEPVACDMNDVSTDDEEIACRSSPVVEQDQQPENTDDASCPAFDCRMMESAKDFIFPDTQECAGKNRH